MRYVVVLISMLICAGAAEKGAEGESIFNGKDLTGWKVQTKGKSDFKYWTVKESCIVVKNCPKKRASNLWTEKKYKDFELTLEFKFGEGNIDSGVFLRSHREQIQLGVSGSLKRDMTCSPYIPIKGKGYPVEAKNIKKLLKVKDWNSMKITAVGSVYKVWLNGEFVMEYNSPSAKKEGPIGLQLHGARVMEVSFRSLKVKELTK